MRACRATLISRLATWQLTSFITIYGCADMPIGSCRCFFSASIFVWLSGNSVTLFRFAASKGNLFGLALDLGLEQAIDLMRCQSLSPGQKWSCQPWLWKSTFYQSGKKKIMYCCHLLSQLISMRLFVVMSMSCGFCSLLLLAFICPAKSV